MFENWDFLPIFKQLTDYNELYLKIEFGLLYRSSANHFYIFINQGEIQCLYQIQFISGRIR